jgi:hypothetical protein
VGGSHAALEHDLDCVCCLCVLCCLCCLFVLLVSVGEGCVFRLCVCIGCKPCGE